MVIFLFARVTWSVDDLLASLDQAREFDLSARRARVESISRCERRSDVLARVR